LKLEWIQWTSLGPNTPGDSWGHQPQGQRDDRPPKMIGARVFRMIWMGRNSVSINLLVTSPSAGHLAIKWDKNGRDAMLPLQFSLEVFICGR
jgi:hypothetical protein